MWRDGLVACERPTPKGDAISAAVDAKKELTQITGDPFHNLLNMRKVLPTHAPDSQCLDRDYASALARLSTPKKTNKSKAMGQQEPYALPPEGHRLLKQAIELTTKSWRAVLQQADSSIVGVVQEWLRQPCVQESSTWTDLFGASPPHGTVQRTRQRLACPGHDSFHNYACLKEFQAEIRRIKKWYQKCRRQWRYKKNFMRKIKGSKEVQSKRLSMNKKLKRHFKRTLRPVSLQGLWAWRKVALCAHRCLIPVHSGTVAVERFWAIFAAMIPRATTNFTEKFFDIISMLSFLRFNRAHFGAWNREGWVRRDPLLMQQLLILQNALAALQDDPAEGGHLQPLYRAFQDYLNDNPVPSGD